MTTKQRWIVGGYVRDLILDREPHDKDFAVGGYTADEYEAVLKAEDVYSKRVVSKSTPPIFISGGDEHALFRKDVKVSAGHNGFDYIYGPDVTMKEDAQRRDITINAIYMSEAGKCFVDPCGGISDIIRGQIKHCSNHGFVLDPLRIFRVARFAAELEIHGFAVDPKTIELMRTMSDWDLPGERIWRELEKALTRSKKPSTFFNVLRECGHLSHWFAPLFGLIDIPRGPDDINDTFTHTMNALDRAKAAGATLETLVAVLCHDFGKGLTDPSILPHHYKHEERSREMASVWLGDTIKAPSNIRKAAVFFAENHMRAHRTRNMREVKLINLAKKVRSRYPGGIKEFLLGANADGPGNDDGALYDAEHILNTVPAEPGRYDLTIQNWVMALRERLGR